MIRRIASSLSVFWCHQAGETRPLLAPMLTDLCRSVDGFVRRLNPGEMPLTPDAPRSRRRVFICGWQFSNRQLTHRLAPSPCGTSRGLKRIQATTPPRPRQNFLGSARCGRRRAESALSRFPATRRVMLPSLPQSCGLHSKRTLPSSPSSKGHRRQGASAKFVIGGLRGVSFGPDSWR